MYFVPPQKWHFQQNGGCVEQRSADNFINKNVIEKGPKGCHASSVVPLEGQAK